MKNTPPTLVNESPLNIGMVCSVHAPKVDPIMVKQAKLTPTSFFGHFVKKAFSAKKPDGSDGIEHMWIEIKSWDGEKFTGLLNNDPILDVGGIVCGSEVTVTPDEIEDFMA